MDIYEYLKKDHKKVSDLFEKFTKTTDIVYQQEIAENITNELLVHAEAEEETFYKCLINYETTKDLIEHGAKEYQEIQNKIAEIFAAISGTAEWQEKVLELQKLVEHHVKEEEGPIFAKAKKVLSENNANVLKEMMHDYKEKMLQEA